jgi:hypothetical protein
LGVLLVFAQGRLQHFPGAVGLVQLHQRGGPDHRRLAVPFGSAGARHDLLRFSGPALFESIGGFVDLRGKSVVRLAFLKPFGIEPLLDGCHLVAAYLRGCGGDRGGRAAAGLFELLESGQGVRRDVPVKALPAGFRDHRHTTLPGSGQRKTEPDRVSLFEPGHHRGRLRAGAPQRIIVFLDRHSGGCLGRGGQP